MTADAFGERLAEVAGPIVVKEVRQGLRARVFGICFGLLLLACLVASLIAAADASNSFRPTGPDYLAIFFAAQTLVCLFVIPFTAFRSMVREREEETWVLVALTGMPARRIVRGKVSSALAQAMLYASCCAPFVLFSYYLNGVDLLSLGFGLWLTFCACVFLVCGAVALGTEGHTRVIRAGTQLLVLLLLVGFTAIALGFGVALAKEGSQWVNTTDFQVLAAVLSFAFLSAAVVLIEAAAANLALATEVNTGGIRKALLAQHVLAIAILYLSVALTEAHGWEIPVVASVASSLALVVTGFFLVSERDGFPRRARGKQRWTTPGPKRGWALLLGLLALDTVAWFFLYLMVGRSNERGLMPLFAAPAYVGLFLSIAAVLGHAAPLQRFGNTVATRASFAVSVAAAGVLLPLMAVVTGGRANDTFFNYLNPFFGMVNFLERAWSGDSQGGLLVLWVFFGIAMLLAWGQLTAHDRERTG